MREDRKSTPSEQHEHQCTKTGPVKNQYHHWESSCPRVHHWLPLASVLQCLLWEHRAHLCPGLLDISLSDEHQDELSNAFVKCSICKVLWPTTSLWLLCYCAPAPPSSC